MPLRSGGRIRSAISRSTVRGTLECETFGFDASLGEDLTMVDRDLVASKLAERAARWQGFALMP